MVLTVENDRVTVGFELAGREERLLSVLFALRDVMHRHYRVGVPGVALQHMHWQAEFGELS